jgi:catechol 2,3-dioxygenase-like lactoylglutathione lyase family enzyme
MIRGIHHTAISTGDMQRSLRFYKDLLGFEEVFAFDWEAGNTVVDNITDLHDSAAQVVMLRAGNACIELFQYAAPSPKLGDPQRPVCDHGITHVCLEVSDIDEEYERLTAAGMRFHCPPQNAGKGLRATYGRDPDGNVVEILEVLDADSKVSVMNSINR